MHLYIYIYIYTCTYQDESSEGEIDENSSSAAPAKEKQTFAAQISSLLAGNELQTHLAKCKRLQASTMTAEGSHEGVNADSEHKVIVRSNALCLQVDDEIVSLHK